MELFDSGLEKKDLRTNKFVKIKRERNLPIFRVSRHFAETTTGRMTGWRQVNPALRPQTEFVGAG